jgi:hypothetical protein
MITPFLAGRDRSMLRAACLAMLPGHAEIARQRIFLRALIVNVLFALGILLYPKTLPDSFLSFLAVVSLGVAAYLVVTHLVFLKDPTSPGWSIAIFVGLPWMTPWIATLLGAHVCLEAAIVSHPLLVILAGCGISGVLWRHLSSQELRRRFVDEKASGFYSMDVGNRRDMELRQDAYLAWALDKAKTDAVPFQDQLLGRLEKEDEPGWRSCLLGMLIEILGRFPRNLCVRLGLSFLGVLIWVGYMPRRESMLHMADFFLVFWPVMSIQSIDFPGKFHVWLPAGRRERLVAAVCAVILLSFAWTAGVWILAEVQGVLAPIMPEVHFRGETLVCTAANSHLALLCLMLVPLFLTFRLVFPNQATGPLMLALAIGVGMSYALSFQALMPPDLSLLALLSFALLSGLFYRHFMRCSLVR